MVEVKSGKLRGSAKRGSSVSLAKGVNNIIGEGANQAFRFIQHLKGLDDVCDEAGNEREIDVSRVSHFLPVVVTFEHFGEIATNKNILFEAGYLDRGIADAYCVCLPDLERIFQILPSVSQRLHYMVKRPEIEKSFLFKGDELDLLVFYLKTGFAIGDAEYDKEQMLVLSHLSPAELDPYILDTTGEEPRPARFLTERWQRVLEAVEARQWLRWTQAVIRLLGMDKEGMEGLEKKLMVIYASPTFAIRGEKRLILPF